MSEVIEGQEVASLPVEQPVKANSDPLLALIERAAFDPAFDPDKLEKLLNQQERILKYQAEQEFNEALLRITKNMPKITKNKSFGYALELLKQGKKARRKYGFRKGLYIYKADNDYILLSDDKSKFNLTIHAINATDWEEYEGDY